MAIQKNLCLAYYSLYLFLERKELIEGPLSFDTDDIQSDFSSKYYTLKEKPFLPGHPHTLL
jgi:hypothetical protein